LIKSFRSKDLKQLFETGKSAKVPANLRDRIVRILDRLDEAENLNDLAVPSYGTHPLRGTKPQRYAMSVNGPWRITFQFDKGEALLVDLEQYH